MCDFLETFRYLKARFFKFPYILTNDFSFLQSLFCWVNPVVLSFWNVWHHKITEILQLQFWYLSMWLNKYLVTINKLHWKKCGCPSQNIGNITKIIFTDFLCNWTHCYETVHCYVFFYNENAIVCEEQFT